MEVSTARIQGRVGSIEEGKEIVSLPWDELTARLKSGSLSAITVLKAYQAAALDVHKKTNSVVCWVEEAEAQAKMLDSVPVGERGPLHGVPVSVKECYDIVGTYSTAGMALFARSRAEVDSPVVKMIKQLGGVPFCKTNVPQVMYSLQCSNPIYGTSTNPHGIAPITKWSQADEDKMADYPTDDMAYKMIRNYCKEAQGLPLGVQVVGRPFMDEQVLRILSELERAG